MIDENKRRLIELLLRDHELTQPDIAELCDVGLRTVLGEFEYKQLLVALFFLLQFLFPFVKIGQEVRALKHRITFKD